MEQIHYPSKPIPAGKPFETAAESPAEVIARARAVLSPRGSWVKNHESVAGKLGSQRCLIRALKDVDGEHVDAAKGFVLQAVDQLGYGIYGTIPSFNDSSKTTKHQILNVLDTAYELATTPTEGKQQ